MFKVKTYAKQELALLYFPDSTDAHTATNRLSAWIKRCPELRQALAGCHQSRYDKFYSAKAVRLIVEYLGEP